MSVATTTYIDADLERALKRPSMTIWLVTATVLAFVLWAGFAWVDEIVRARGELVSKSRPQIIQNLEGGILAEISVKEGDIVNPGDVLARLYGTKFKTAVDDLEEQLATLEIRKLRLEAQGLGQKVFDVSYDLARGNAGIVASEQALLFAKVTDLESRMEGARSVLNQANKELGLLEGMLKQQIVSLIEVTRARKTASDAAARFNDIVTQAELDRTAAYSDVLKEIGTLKQNLKQSQDQLDRTVLVAPMRGIVNNLSVTTIGGVVRPGEEIFQIIPLDEELFVEAHVPPEDIAGVKPGQKATVKLTAYDYTIYGSLNGVVDFISADTFKDERAQDGDPHYRVMLRVDTQNLSERQKRIRFRPGMQTEVELHTGSKTILQYLLKPLYKSREAFREP